MPERRAVVEQLEQPEGEQDVNEYLRGLRGVVATVVTTGKVEEHFMECMMEMRSWADRAGFWNIEWRNFISPFVEVGRDEVVMHTLQEGYDWCLQIDADASFKPDTLYRLLYDAFVAVPDADVMGAYSQLKGAPNLPTIDSGTGTWEVVYPGVGIVPVIRTGGHCLLIKKGILERMAPGPWFRVRDTLSPVKAMQEIDNFARMHLDGDNPLSRQPDWERLLQLAKQAGSGQSMVGEDSGFSDRAKLAGARMYVDTDIVTGHISKHVIGPEDLKENMDKLEEGRRLVCGILE